MRTLWIGFLLGCLVLLQTGCAALSKETRMAQKQIRQTYLTQIAMSARSEAGHFPRFDPDALTLNAWRCPHDGLRLDQFELVERTGGGTNAYYCSREKVYWIRVWNKTGDTEQENWYGPLQLE